ncbi:ABC transporter permease [Enterococcus dispar]|uniref:ABC transporter permease n=1 Tax=Enterococcus dispar TaxID=44009 RepID=UPI0021D42A1D|nr:iron chelate uptake ABC transporter family permease subunit [Enterococcus dispar]MCU7358102.1 iron chelate uptake ABC transporter family permease subunit [Enterococcus dispar]MDT2705619.1 iron chelate uptake ABC transporter family permease subunit [Enterococcus dispar]
MKKTGIFLLVILCFLSIFSGVGEMSMNGLMQGIKSQWLLLEETRLPRTVSVILAGSMLSICGLVTQKVLQNRFVSTSSIGMMDSARLGILLVMLFMPNSSIWQRTLVAFVFSYVGVLAFLFLTRLLPKNNPLIIPLTGMMFGNIIGAIANFFGYQFQLVQNMSSWLQGNFATVMKEDYRLIYLTIPVFIIIFLLLQQIMVLSLGDDLAQNLGVNVKQMQFVVLGLVALGSSVVLIMVGSVPFLGIVVPNLVTWYFGDHLHHSLAFTGIWGANFLLICDLLARNVIAPYELPVSVVVGVIGGIIFLLLIMRRRKLA